MKYKIHFISFIYSISIGCLISCISINSNEIDERKTNDLPLIQVDSGEAIKEKIFIGFMNYYINSRLVKVYQEEKSKQEIESVGCEQWVIASNAISGILHHMRLVESTEWNAKCYYYPCHYIGSVTNGINNYKIHINSGSFVLLYNDQETLYFINSEVSDYFLTPCDCCE